MKAQIPPSTATLTDSASNSVMAFPHRFRVAGARIHRKWFWFFCLGSVPLKNIRHNFRTGAREILAVPQLVYLLQRSSCLKFIRRGGVQYLPISGAQNKEMASPTPCGTSLTAFICAPMNVASS